MIDFDQVLKDTGEFGRYQKLAVALLCLPTCFMASYHQLGLPYLTYTPEHKCKLPIESNATSDQLVVTVDQCHIYYHSPVENTTDKVKCSEWEYDDYYFSETFVTKFNLVCDSAIVNNNVLAILGVAIVIGSLLFSVIQDTYGRRIAFVVSVLTCVFGSILSLFAPSVELFAVFRFVASLNGIAAWNCGYIWALEFVGPSKRTLVTALMCTTFAFATMSMSLIAFFCRTWVQMGLVLSVPFLLLLLYPFILFESPRWLLTKSRFEEATKVMKSMVKWSDRRSFSAKALDSALASMARGALELVTASIDQKIYDIQEKMPDVQLQASILDLFKGKQMRRKTMLITLCWTANAVTYTTIIFNVSNLGGNFYITFALTALVEAPACLLNIFIINRLGRIWPLCTGMITAGTACALTAVAGSNEAAVIGLAVLGKFFISMTYAVLCQLASELYPTAVRGSGVGFSCVVANLANIAMPYLIASSKAYKFLPMVTIGLLAITSGISSFFLPETMERPLPETVAEAELDGMVGWSTAGDHFRQLCRRRPSAKRRNQPNDEDGQKWNDDEDEEEGDDNNATELHTLTPNVETAVDGNNVNNNATAAAVHT